MAKPSVFISYSHKDEEWKDRLKPQLDALEMAGEIVVWDDRKIDGGDKWYPEIEEAMSNAAVAVCLISENFLASEFCVKEEIPFLLNREQENHMLFIPVLISPCPWKAFRWLSETQMLPRDGKSIIKDFKDNWAVAFADVADLILRKINDPDYSLPVATIKWTEPEKIDIDRLPETGAKLFGREKELEHLDEAWESAQTNIVSFIAWGGVGKSTLINKWIEYMKADNYKDAEQVFAWSFYSQGTNEQVSSADTFFFEALRWFGDPDPTSGSAWDKGQRLAGLVRQKKTLLVLDGMEPLQSSHEFEKGKIKDQGLASLLRSIAMNNNGLCIITSRENITDIAKYQKRVKQVDLEKLTVDAGRALLRVGGVRGTDKELEDAVEEFGYHAFAIKLLPVYLKNIKGHHISNTQHIPDLDIPDNKGRHPRRVIEALSKRYMDKPEGDLLKILGFFDRPADIAAIKQIIEEPVIQDLTANICDTNETALLQSINTLRNENLLANESKHNPDTLDCHPLIREHFGEKLKQQNPDGWKEAHVRLYEYYRGLPEKLYGKELPDTLEEMEPLFAAVMHGCLAGKHQEAMHDVFFDRIRRQNTGYDIHTLGAFGADLSCLSCFFEVLWDKLDSSLTEEEKSVTLHGASYVLSAVGRHVEAVQPMKAAIESAIKLKDLGNVARGTSAISQLYLTLGDVASAQEYGEHCVTFADRSGDGFQMESKRTAHADALHKAGRNEAAEKLFIEAEKMQKKRQSDSPWLYSAQGFQFCDLLLSMGEYQEVLERGRYAIKIKTLNPLLDFGLNSLTIGKALMLQSVGNNSTDTSTKSALREVETLSTGFTEAEDYLNQAVDGLREAGAQEFIPLGLFTCATLYRHQKDFLKSWADLDEAREIAEYGRMRLHLTDYCLEVCRNIKAQLAVGDSSLTVFEIIEEGETLSLTKGEMEARFEKHFKEAERLVEETGYHRRDGELKVLKR